MNASLQSAFSTFVLAATIMAGGAAGAYAQEPVATTAETETAPEDDPANENLANELTKRHRLQQNYTIRRKVDGAVVETTQKAVSIDGSIPTRPTEAGGSIEERLKASFDQELLTRTEALTEAKLDFALGDVDRDGTLSEQEFIRLVDLLAQNGSTSDEGLEPRRSFVSELNDADQSTLSFQEFAGPDTVTIDEKKFTLEFLRRFDAADIDEDGLLSGAELRSFRRIFGA